MKTIILPRSSPSFRIVVTCTGQAEGQAAKANTKDQELLRRFEEIDKLSEQDNVQDQEAPKNL
jgi:hypothetical protein